MYIYAHIHTRYKIKLKQKVISSSCKSIYYITYIQNFSLVEEFYFARVVLSIAYRTCNFYLLVKAL